MPHVSKFFVGRLLAIRMDRSRRHGRLVSSKTPPSCPSGRALFCSSATVPSRHREHVATKRPGRHRGCRWVADLRRRCAMRSSLRLSKYTPRRATTSCHLISGGQNSPGGRPPIHPLSHPQASVDVGGIIYLASHLFLLQLKHSRLPPLPLRQLLFRGDGRLKTGTSDLSCEERDILFVSTSVE